MLFENLVAQMLTCSGHKLYFYSDASRDDKDSRMELDFLIEKKTITSKHNITPIEVKSGKNYTLNSLRKAKKKYGDYLEKPIVIHSEDLKETDEALFIPIYMAPFL